jgi:hypothetical protein
LPPFVHASISLFKPVRQRQSRSSFPKLEGVATPKIRAVLKAQAANPNIVLSSSREPQPRNPPEADSKFEYKMTKTSHFIVGK